VVDVVYLVVAGPAGVTGEAHDLSVEADGDALSGTVVVADGVVGTGTRVPVGEPAEGTVDLVVFPI
jgi:hypothetical protein